MARKVVAYFKTVGKFRSHQMGSRTRYLPVPGANGPEFTPVSERRFKVNQHPTPVYDEAVADRLRAEKYFGRSFIECNADGSPLGTKAAIVKKGEPAPAPVPEPRTPENHPVPEDALEVRDINGALAYFAGHVEGFDVEMVRDAAGRLSAPKVKKFAAEKGIVFPNYG